jgi:hypothetical protein
MSEFSAAVSNKTKIRLLALIDGNGDLHALCFRHRHSDVQFHRFRGEFRHRLHGRPASGLSLYTIRE